MQLQNKLREPLVRKRVLYSFVPGNLRKWIRNAFSMLLLCCCISSTLAQRPVGFEWLHEPQLDSVTPKYFDVLTFRIYNYGKVGFYNALYNLWLAPEYEFIGYWQEVDNNNYRPHFIVTAKKAGKWGMYALIRPEYHDLDEPMETEELLPLEYDSITLYKDLDDEIHARVRQGRKWGIYEPEGGYWSVELAEKHPPKKNPQGFVIPSIAYSPPALEVGIDDAVAEYDPRATAGYYEKTRNSKLADDDVPAPAEPAPQIKKSTVRYGKEGERDSNQLWELERLGPNNEFTRIAYLGRENRPTGIMHTGRKKILIEPIYASVSFYDNFFYCSNYQKYNGSKVFNTVFDTTGKMVASPLRIVEYVEGLRLVAGESHRYGIYDRNWRAILPMVYEEAEFNHKGHFILQKNQKYYVFDIKKQTLLPDSFDRIVTDVSRPFMLAEQKKNLLIYNTVSAEKRKLKKMQFGHAMSNVAVLVKGKKQALLNLESGVISAFDYDSIRLVANTYRHGYRTGWTNRYPHIVLAKVYQGQKMGLMDASGVLLVNCIYNSGFFIRPEVFQFTCGRNSEFQAFYSLRKKVMVIDSISSYELMDYRVPANFDRARQYDNKMSHYFVSWKRLGKIGISKDMDSVVLPAVFDSVWQIQNHTFLKNEKGYYLLNVHQLPYSEKDHYDSIRPIVPGVFILYQNGLQSLLNSAGDLEIENTNSRIEPLETMWYSLYSYSVVDKVGVIQTLRINTGAVFEAVRFGRNDLLWAKQNGKWGLIKYSQKRSH